MEHGRKHRNDHCLSETEGMMKKTTFYFARDSPWLFLCQPFSINLRKYERIILNEKL